MAKRKVEDDDTFDLRRWWAKKYDRPSNDPRFLERPSAVWIQEMYEDAYTRKEDLESQLEDEGLKMENKRELRQKLRGLYAALGEGDETQGDDPLVDKWEREFEAGFVPDLDER